MRIADGRESLYQWEHDQQLIVEEGITEVHFDNGTTSEALPCPVKEVDGERRVDVPNIFLQTAAQISAYAWDGSSVVSVLHIWVEPKAKPADYVYTQTEVLRIETEIAAQLQELKDSGDLTGPVGPKGPQGETGKPGADGHTPVRGVDYWTEADKAEIKSYVDEAILGGAW